MFLRGKTNFSATDKSETPQTFSSRISDNANSNIVISAGLFTAPWSENIKSTDKFIEFRNFDYKRSNLRRKLTIIRVNKKSSMMI
ncbi:hypothetical protein HYE05_00870 [Mycoplasmopsis bovis]|nr:hypothetical protein [Mycoplasmopsis bovis]QQH27497.1 hypothetical protein HYE05_00870 [Mycoplasmopsis bovis]